MMITWTTFILWYLYDMEMRLIIVHGFMNNVYHNSSCMTTIDHCHERLLIMYHNCWSLPWKTVDHTWSLICITVDHVSQLLIMSMKHRWSYMINIDHCHESLLIMYHNCWSCIISWSLNDSRPLIINIIILILILSLILILLLILILISILINC